MRRKPTENPETKNWWKHALSVLAAIAILVCVVYELGLSTDPKIIVLQEGSGKSSTTFLRPLSVYEQTAQQQLNKSINNRTKLTVNTANVTTYLKQHYPELAGVSIALPFLGHRLVIYIEPAAPAAVLVSQTSGNFVLNNTGQALRQLSSVNVPQTAGLPIIVDQSGLRITSGHMALPSSYIAFVQQLLAQLKAVKIIPENLILPPAAGELDLHISGVPYFVKFNLYDSSSANQQIGTYFATEKYLAGQGITPSQYIDARVPGRAYYK